MYRCACAQPVWCPTTRSANSYTNNDRIARVAQLCFLAAVFKLKIYTYSCNRHHTFCMTGGTHKFFFWFVFAADDSSTAQSFRNSWKHYKSHRVESFFCDMTTRAGPWNVVAGNHIENVMKTVKTCPLPPTNVTQEVTELHRKSWENEHNRKDGCSTYYPPPSAAYWV